MKRLILKHALMQVFCEVPESLIENWEAITQQPDETAFFELLKKNETTIWVKYDDSDKEQLIDKVNDFIFSFTEFYKEVKK